MIPIVIMASGRGSNFDAIWKAIQKGELKAEIAAVISDRPDALVLSKAKQAGIPAVVLPFPPSAQRSSEPQAQGAPAPGSPSSLADRRRRHEEILLKELEKYQPRFLVLAGYMRILTAHLIEAFRSERGYSRIVNIHPSILPAFPGICAYAQAFRYGVKVAGATVHLVEPEVDSGPICAQEVFSIEDCQSELEVEQRGLEIEHRLFPQILRWVVSEEFTVEKRLEGRLYVRPNRSSSTT